MHLFFFSISSLSEGNSGIKYLKSLSSKSDARVSSEVLINCKESIKVIFLLTIIVIYFSIALGITSIVTSKLFSSLKIKCPSYPCKLWKIFGSFLWSLKFKLRLLCETPLNLPVIWQWSLTLSVFNSSFHRWHMFELI